MYRRFRNAVHIHEHRLIVCVAAVPILKPAQLKRLAAEDDISECELTPQLFVFFFRMHQLVKR